MSDHDATPDPIDKAYAQAQAMLDDEAARAARRARVLAAVARETEAPAPAAPSKPRLSWARGRWLAAASVAGLSVLIATQFDPPSELRPKLPPAKPPVAAAPPPVTGAAPAPAPRAQTPAPPFEPAVTAQAETRSRGVPVTAAPPPLPPPPWAQAAPASAPPSVSDPAADSVQERVARSRQAEAPPEAGRAASAAMRSSVPASPAVTAARLRAAAAAGRTAELTALLAQGAFVEAPDDDGETALMKAVQGNHPAAAALLRRHGADLDLQNRAGVSARDMAASIDDPGLNRALGLAP